MPDIWKIINLAIRQWICEVQGCSISSLERGCRNNWNSRNRSPNIQTWLRWVIMAHIVTNMVFPVVMYGCESWTIKKVKLRRIHVLELWCKRRLLRGPWTKEIKPVNPKGNHPWIFIGSTDGEAEAPRFQPSNAKSQLTGKDSRGGRDCGQEEKGVKEDEMVRWNHRLSGHEFEQTAEDSEGSLARCSPRDCKESDRAEQIQLAQFSFCITLKQSFH